MPITPGAWVVWKFGGTSVANSDRLINVADLICQHSEIPLASGSITHQREMKSQSSHTSKSCRSSTSSLLSAVSSSSNFSCLFNDPPIPGFKSEKKYHLAVVVSAMAGITDALQSSCDEAAMEFHRRRKCSKNEALYGKLEYCQSLEEVKRRHFETVDELLAKGEIEREDADTFKQIHEEDISKISEILKAFSLSGTCPISLREMVMGHGELWSSRLLFSIVKKRQACVSNQSKTHGVAINGHVVNENQLNGVKQIDQAVDAVVTNDNCPLETTIQRKTGVCDFCLPCSVHMDSDIRCCGSKAVRWIDARQILVVKDSSCSTGVYEKVTLNYSASNINMQDWLIAHPVCRVAIITGYICSTRCGTPATLKRNGSDYSGSLFANLLKAKLYTVWTDVDGVYTADPRKVPTAFRLPFLSYIEAIELAYFGAKVLHPLTMEPCISSNIPIVLRSSLHPQSPGTLIGVSLPESPVTTPNHHPQHTVIEPAPLTLPEPTMKGISLSPSTVALTKLNSVDKKKALAGYCKAFTLIDNVSLVNVAGTSMIGVPGIASRLFGAVHEASCSVVMISQASSEHSICFAVLSSQAERAKAAVEAAFYKEMRHDLSMRVSVTPHCTIICAVGERMCGALGILGRLSTSLANAEVNVKAVTQGASEINITFVVETSEATRAIRAMHDAIYSHELLNNGIKSTTRSQSYVKLMDHSMKSSHKKSSLVSVTRSSNIEEDCIRLVLLVPSLPLPPPMESRVLQMASDIHQRSLDPTPLEREGLPVRIVGYTDGIVYVEKLQASEQTEASTLPRPSVNDLLFDKNGQSPLVLMDLRHWAVESVFGFARVPIPCSSSLSSTHMTIQELQRCQSQFVQQWKGRGRMVIDSSSFIQVAPVFDSLLRMVALSSSNSPHHKHIDHHCNNPIVENPDFQSHTDESSSTHYSNPQVISEDDSLVHSLPPRATPDIRNRRRSFTAEDIKF